MRKEKSPELLEQQRNEFLKECPVCGNKFTYIKGTNALYCDHIGTKHSEKKLYYRLLNKRGQLIANELFGE